MRKVRKELMYALFFGMMAFFLFGFDYTQWEYTKEDPAPVWNTDTVKFSFDDSYTAGGTELMMAEIEILDENETRVLMIEEDLTGATPEDGMFIIPCRQYWEQVADGLYGARGRVYDTDGNASPWSETRWFKKQWRPVPAPGGCYLLR